MSVLEGSNFSGESPNNVHTSYRLTQNDQDQIWQDSTWEAHISKESTTPQRKVGWYRAVAVTSVTAAFLVRLLQ